MSTLAARQLLKNKKRTLITIIGIILSVAMVTAVAGFVVSTQDMLRRTYIAHKGDYHAGIFPVTQAQALSIAEDSRIESSFTETSDKDGRQAVFFRIKNVDRKYERLTWEIADDYGVQAEEFIYHEELLAAEGVLAKDQTLLTLYAIGGILGMIILAGSVIVIANAFYISASERTMQFGVLKSAGATKSQIRQTVLAEGMILSIAGIPLGILAGLAVETAALAIANRLLYEVSQLNDGGIYFSVIVSGWALAASAAISLITVFLSAWFPAGRAAKISAIDAIKLSKEIRVRPGQVRVSPLIQSLFGFEGTLAAKALKRSSGKYRATVISLVVSITLFVIGSGFGLMITKSTDIVYKDYGVNVLMNYRDADADALGEITARLAELPGEMSNAKTVNVQIPLPDFFLTNDAKEYLGNTSLLNGPDVPSEARFIAVDDDSFENVCYQAGISSDSLTQTDEPKGILVNVAAMDYSGGRVEFQPFNYKNNISLTVNQQNKDAQYDIELVGSVADIPASVAAVAYYDQINIILSESAFDAFASDIPTRQAHWVVKAENPAQYCEAAEEIFMSVAAEESYYVYNYETGARMTRDINLLMMIFVYGFIGMLSLIAVTSVIGTISTNITLRMPEFAMLSSVGMTTEGLRRMLNLESLFYGLKALFIGLPLATVFYYLLYRAFGNSIGFAFIWPWKSMLVCVAVVMLIAFGTMRYATKVLEGKNIVELIRKINI